MIAQTDALQPYLAATRLCDHDHPRIRQQVAALTALLTQACKAKGG